MNTETKSQNFTLARGENLEGSLVLFIGIIRNRMEAASATTPPSLDGIERRMAYANRKYHSGWIWIGVERGFAGLRFSTSPRTSGFFEISSPNEMIRMINGRESFRRNLGVNLILSMFEWLWCGEEDPVS